MRDVCGKHVLIIGAGHLATELGSYLNGRSADEVLLISDDRFPGEIYNFDQLNLLRQHCSDIMKFPYQSLTPKPSFIFVMLAEDERDNFEERFNHYKELLMKLVWWFPQASIFFLSNNTSLCQKMAHKIDSIVHGSQCYVVVGIVPEDLRKYHEGDFARMAVQSLLKTVIQFHTITFSTHPEHIPA